MTTAGFGDFSFTKNRCDPIRRVPDISIVNIKKGDTIVVTSDGLFEKFGGPTKICSGKPVEILANDVKRGIDENVPDLARFLLDQHIAFMCTEYIKNFDPTDECNPLEIKNLINKNSDNKCVLTYIFQ
jgi:serine/threonine protein phosphatase PrpC